MLNNLLQEELQEVRESFKVEDLQGANWCFRKLTALQAKKNENNQLADAEIQRIQAWRDKENKSIDDNIAYFEGLVTEYYRELKQADPKAKLTTPYGKVSSRKTQKWIYNDEKLMEFLKTNGFTDLIKIKEEVNKADLKKVFKNGVNQTTGEVLDGVEIFEEESISVKID